MERKKNILDKIGALIPGFKGYVIRDEKRNTDQKLREHLLSNITTSEKTIIEHQQILISKSDSQTCQEWELVRKAINTLSSKIKYASYGESSFFAETQLKENELDEIYNMDLEIAERVDLLCTMVKKHINESLSSIAIMQQIRMIDELIQNRALYIKNFK